MGFTICIVGMGLMGASMAGALRGFRGARIVGADISAETRDKAARTGWFDAVAPSAEEGAAGADLVLFCVYARHIPALLKDCLPALKPGCVLADICGVKGPLYEEIIPMLPAGAVYVGLHPMAGRERDGIDNADPALYRNSSMLICPTGATTPAALRLAEELARHIGCARVRAVPCEEHDAIIAYTSDLMHLSAAGLCLDFPAEMDLSFTAGAYRDCTRVADINAAAWTELLMENRPHTLARLVRYIGDLGRLRDALQNRDEKALHALLQRAGDNKREMLRR